MGPLDFPQRLTAPELEPVFWPASRIGATSAWWGHVPFVHWLVSNLRPGLAVELGTQSGVSFAAICEAMQRSRAPGHAYAIDTWKGDPHSGFYDEGVYADLAAFVGARYGSFAELVRLTFDEALPYFADGSIDLLHIDGYHTYEAVRSDFENWRPKVSEKGVVLFHDTHVRRDDFGVWRFWAELTSAFPSFEFFHSHGLGLVAVGPVVPEAVAELCRLERAEASAVRERFAQLGARWIAADAAVRAEGHAQYLASENARLAAHLDRASAAEVERECLERVATARAQRIAELEAERNRLVQLSTAQEQRIADLEADAERLADVSAAQNQRVADLDAERVRLNALLVEQELRAGDLEAELRGVAEDSRAQDRQIADLKAERERLAALSAAQEQHLGDMAAGRERLADTAAAERRRVMDLERERERLAELSRVQGRQIADLEAERDRMADLSATQFQHIGDLEGALARRTARGRDQSMAGPKTAFLSGVQPSRWFARRELAAPDRPARENLSDASPQVLLADEGAPRPVGPGALPRPEFMANTLVQGRDETGPAQPGSAPLCDSSASGVVERMIERLNASAIFSPTSYATRNPDVAAAQFDPVRHYAEHGAREGRSFATYADFARALNPLEAEHDVAASAYLAEYRRAVERAQDLRVFAERVSVGIVIHSQSNFFMHPIASALNAALAAYGVDRPVLTENDDLSQLDVPIIVAPHEFFTLGVPGNYASDAFISRCVCFNTEQLVSPWISVGMEFILKSRALIDINFQSALLFGAGFPATHLLPPFSTAQRSEAIERADPLHPFLGWIDPRTLNLTGHPGLLRDRSLDVFFTGFRTEERTRFFVRNARFFADRNCCILYSKLQQQPILGEDLYRDAFPANLVLAANSKIVLNLHRYPLGFFEWERMLVQGFASGACVVCNAGLRSPFFSPGIHYFEDITRNLEKTLKFLLDDPQGMRMAQEAATSARAIVDEDLTPTKAGAHLLSFLKHACPSIQ